VAEHLLLDPAACSSARAVAASAAFGCDSSSQDFELQQDSSASLLDLMAAYLVVVVEPAEEDLDGHIISGLVEQDCLEAAVDLHVPSASAVVAAFEVAGHPCSSAFLLSLGDACLPFAIAITITATMEQPRALPARLGKVRVARGTPAGHRRTSCRFYALHRRPLV